MDQLHYSDSEPEPDIAIVRLPESTYNNRHPEPEDIFWVIEVAKTSLKKDLDLKGSIYATAEIQEYWVLDISTKQLIVFREPQNGQYVIEQTFLQGEVIPLAFPDVRILIERLLG
jgi:Uma2 family endonuclease